MPSLAHDLAINALLCSEAEPKLRHFRFLHLPESLQSTSRAFAELALHIVDTIKRSPERTICLDKLREAKDRAVTARLDDLEAAGQ